MITLRAPDALLQVYLSERLQNGRNIRGLASRLIAIRGEKLRLTVTGYALLKYLALRKRMLATHDQLLRAAKGPSFHHEDSHYLSVHVAQLGR